MKATAFLATTMLALATPALAADKGGPAPAIPLAEPVAYSWTGAYAGIHAGFTSSDVEDKLAGLHVGYRHHQGMLVYGAELSATMADPRNPDFDNVLAAATGSIGFAFDRLMIYGKGGYAFNELVDGWTYGLGASYALNDRWHIGVEAMRADFGPDGEVKTYSARIGRRF